MLSDIGYEVIISKSAINAMFLKDNLLNWRTAFPYEEKNLAFKSGCLRSVSCHIPAFLHLLYLILTPNGKRKQLDVI